LKNKLRLLAIVISAAAVVLGILFGFQEGYDQGKNTGYLSGWDDGVGTIEDEIVFTVSSGLFPIIYECHIFPKEDPWDGYTNIFIVREGKLELVKRVPLVRPPGREAWLSF